MEDTKKMVGAQEGTPQATKPDPPETKPKRREIITEDDVQEANQRLQEYVTGKASIDAKATANQEWWRGRHWNQIQQNNKALENEKKPASAWLFNSIINKHADIMDNFPKPNVLPREADDVQDAESLSKIIPCILEQNGYQKVYSDKAYDFIGDGTAITGVFWDNQKNNGMGDIVIKQIDIHNIFWKPGIDNIQDSPEVFTIAAIDNDELIKMYPEMEGHTGTDFTKTEYLHDDTIDTSDMSYIVDWYYKTTEYEMVPMDALGETSLPRPKTILHYCKFCNGQVLYSSENEGLEKGFYHHGKYPFVFQRMFPVKDSPVGFGFIDVMKDPQMYIDVMDELLANNAFKVGQTRYFAREDLGLDIDEFRDYSKPFVKYAGGNLEEALVPIQVPTIPAFVLQYQTNKIEELKETSANRDFSQGTTSAGVTAASAIAALQEAGSKTARDMNRACHYAHHEECYFVLELIRQFYTETRSFRVDDGKGGYQFVDYDNSNISDEAVVAMGLQPVDNQMRRRPIFDLQIVAEKQSPFSRAAQNETAKEMYSMGFFNPDMAEPAQIALSMMDFEGKDDVVKKVQDQSLMMQQLQQMMGAIQAFDMSYPEFGLAQAAGLAPAMPMGAPEGGAPVPQGAPMQGTPEERAAKLKGDSTLASKARMKAANQASVG